METIVTLAIPITFLLLLGLERVFPARKLPKVKWWVAKGFFFFVVFGAFNAILPSIVGPAVGPHAPFHFDRLGTIGGAIAAFLLSDIVSYGVHRLLHNVPFLWRWTHQMHHSAERLDVAGAVYFHPFDLVAQIVPTTVAVTLLGVSADAGALAGFIGFFYAVFQHLNVRTPQWLGYVIQRPEAHAVHHGRGIHAYNYGNFPLWDIVLGTFRNPAERTEPTGFWDGASSKMGSMLIGRDVADPAGTRATVDESDAVPAE